MFHSKTSYTFMIAISVLLVISCDNKLMRKAKELERKHKKCVSYGKNNIKFIKQFNDVYPGAKNFIGSFGSRRKTDWNSIIGLYGRYELSMKIPVKLNKKRTKFKVVGDPEFQLVEVKSITKEKDGRPYISYNGQSQRDFGKTKWKKIYNSGGDISVLNLKVKKHKPHKNFDEAWK